MNMHVKPKLVAGQKAKVIKLGPFASDITVGNVYDVLRTFNDGDIYIKDDVGDTNRISAANVELAPRFAVGDKVEFTDKVPTAFWFGPHTKYKGGTVSAVNLINGCADYDVDVFDGDYPAFVDADHIRPAPTYTSCAAAEVDNLAAEYGAPAPRAEAKPKVRSLVNQYDVVKGKAYDVEESDNDGVWVKDDVNDSFYLLNSEFEHVAVAPATATLTIIAGRYYKTRGGRKVGPMERDSAHRDGHWYWHAPEADGAHVQYWAKDGGFYIDRGETNLDLIAEWAVVAAQQPPSSIADIVARHSSTGTAIVCLLENGKPAPAIVPFVHASSGAAETEATRLANIHRGKEFGVYTLGAVAKVERNYDHEWQRLAAGGQKINAIKAYRDAGGKRETFIAPTAYSAGYYDDRHVIGLKEAKDAVEHWLAAA